MVSWRSARFTSLATSVRSRATAAASRRGVRPAADVMFGAVARHFALDDGRVIDTSVSIDTTPERAWNAWADPQQIANWFVDRAEGVATGNIRNFGLRGTACFNPRVDLR